MKDLLSFDTETMIKPTEAKHVAMILREISNELDNIMNHWNVMMHKCEQEKTSA